MVGLITAGTGIPGEKILGEYPPGAYPNAFERASAMVGDVQYACPTLAANQLLSRWVRSTFAYEFDDAGAGLLGAMRSAELAYFFNLNWAVQPRSRQSASTESGVSADDAGVLDVLRAFERHVCQRSGNLGLRFATDSIACRAITWFGIDHRLQFTTSP